MVNLGAMMYGDGEWHRIHSYIAISNGYHCFPSSSSDSSSSSVMGGMMYV